MLICIDYDDTYTKDPELWRRFLAIARSRGHKIICVTMRYRSEGLEVIKELQDYTDNIYFTSRIAKKTYLDKQNIFPNIWIDDQPLWIFTNALPEEPTEEN